jgi:phosphonate transport system substrate-binding protein
MKLITYLAPSIPADFFRLVARDLEADIEFNEVISGPLPGDEEPFSGGRVDVGFVCSPTYRWLRGRVELLPLPVPSDARSNGRPVYFADVIVRAGAAAQRIDDLRGATWAYNDRNSRSGWFGMIERCGDDFFSRTVMSGSHLRSIEMVLAGEASAASIDSNALRLRGTDGLRVIESWGPYAIQPAVIRADLRAAEKQHVARRLLTLHDRHDLRPFGYERFVEPDESLYA